MLDFCLIFFLLQMFMEMQALTPLVPTRECYFLRYCQQNVEEGTWAIVDFPLDSLHNNFPAPFSYFKRRLSGCIIQDMPNGYSRVILVLFPFLYAMVESLAH